MESTAYLDSFNIQNFSQSQQADFNVNSAKLQSNQNISNTLYINEEYPVTNYNKAENNISNNYNQSFGTFDQTLFPDVITKENSITTPTFENQYSNLSSNNYNSNQINSFKNSDIINNNINSNEINSGVQLQSNVENNLNNLNDLNTFNSDININSNFGNTNNVINPKMPMDNIKSNIMTSNNVISSNIPNIENININNINNNNDNNNNIFNSQQMNNNNIFNSQQMNENNNIFNSQQMNNNNLFNSQQMNNNNEEFPSFRLYHSNKMKSQKSITSEKNDIKKSRVSSPKLVDPLETKVPPSPPSVHDMQSVHEEIKEPKEEEKEQELVPKLNLTKDEKILLRKEEPNKEYNIKSHFDLILTKDENKFFYNKVNKIATPLLAHYEMPDNLEYKSPILSPNGKFIACIGKGNEDSVFVWDISDLYWYKYKYSYSTVDCIAFTPNSKSLIIVYSNSNPIMYDLSTGKMQLEFENNFEENNSNEKYRCTCAFTLKDTHFALTTSTSYTLWSLRTGKIKQQIMDESPIKIASNDHLIFIDNQLNCTIKKITDQSIIEQFNIKGVESIDEILDARCTRDMANLVYVIKHGIIVYNFKNKEFNGLQKFECGVEKATLSSDGKYILKTNMKNFVIYDLEKGATICTILKDKFKEYNIDYIQKKILIIDNISIIMKDFTDEKSPEKYIWLNKNPTRFSDVKFSNDFKILLARLNRNNAVVYDLKSGYIIKKWENLDENWLDYCMTTFGGEKIAVKTNLLLIKVWNYRTGKEEATFHGFNSHSIAFNADGDYLLCGTKNGSEIARIWSIPEQKYGTFKYNGNNNNYNTKVHITFPIPKRLICCSVDQQPLIFNAYTKELLTKCECPYRFEEIYEIQSELNFNVFVIKARDNKKRNVGILYRISDGALLETYENYTVLELVRYEGILISKCDNVNGGKLTATNFQNLDEPKLIDFKIESDHCQLLNDSKSAIVTSGDEFSKEFIFINIKNGDFIGKIDFVKKHERYSEIYITADPDESEINFRYFEFLTPQETMTYLKKNIFNVNEEENA